jgi:hypothetical protein
MWFGGGGREKKDFGFEEAEDYQVEKEFGLIRYSPCNLVSARIYPTNFFTPPQLRATTTNSTMPILTYTCTG